MFQRVEYSGRMCRCILFTVVHNIIGIILFITIIDAMTLCTTGSNFVLQIVNDSIRGSSNKMCLNFANYFCNLVRLCIILDYMT